MKSTILIAALLALICVSIGSCLAEEQPPTTPSLTEGAKTPITLKPKGMWAGNPMKFFQGAFVGLAGHEMGHVIANFAVGSDPYLKSVHYGPIPWLTIEPGRSLDNRDHYITASAGFNAQNIANECILTSHPNLSKEDQPFLKGAATFNFWLTVGYAATTRWPASAARTSADS